jgi:hypothetical protein
MGILLRPTEIPSQWALIQRRGNESAASAIGKSRGSSVHLKPKLTLTISTGFPAENYENGHIERRFPVHLNLSSINSKLQAHSRLFDIR